VRESVMVIAVINVNCTPVKNADEVVRTIVKGCVLLQWSYVVPTLV